MKFPPEVKLGPFTYRVTSKARDWKKLDRDMDSHWGYTDHGSATILMRPDLNPALERVTLLHEVLHAAAFAGGVLDTRKRPEEAWVVMVAPMLLDAMDRSPGLAEFLFGS